MGCRKRYCPSDLPLRSIPPAALRLRVPACGRGWPGSSGQHRLRPCISTPSHFLLHLPHCVVCSTGGTASSIVLRTFRSAPSPPLRFACGYPLTAAGGQGPQDNTAYGLAYPLLPTSCCTSPPCVVCSTGGTASSIVLRTFRYASSPPLRFACGYPLTAAGAQSGTIDLRTVWDHRLAYGLGPSAFARMAFFK